MADQFASACKGYCSSLIQRCFIFCPGDSQLDDDRNKGTDQDVLDLVEKKPIGIIALLDEAWYNISSHLLIATTSSSYGDPQLDSATLYSLCEAKLFKSAPEI